MTGMGLSARKGTVRQEILLQTEPAEHVPGYIVGNALCPHCHRPTPHDAFLASVTPHPCDCDPPVHPGRHPVLVENEFRGREVVICGAGPSLAKYRPFLSKFKGEIWGGNRALGYLHEWGVTRAKGIAIDPSTRMFGEVWPDPPETEYYLATSVNPGLVMHLERHGRPIRYFHSYRGAEGELSLYAALYPKTVLAGRGLNVVNRAVDVAEYLGFSRIYLAGADNCLGRDDALYADGGKVRDDGDVILQGEIDGKRFRTKADMLMSGVDLVRKQRELRAVGVKLTFLGDTLPRALMGKPEPFLERVITWSNRPIPRVG